MNSVILSTPSLLLLFCAAGILTIVSIFWKRFQRTTFVLGLALFAAGLARAFLAGASLTECAGAGLILLILELVRIFRREDGEK